MLHRLCALLCLPSLAFGWSMAPHQAITRAAVALLPAWERELMGPAESALLIEKYCLIPDDVFSDKANAKYAAMPSKPGEVYIQQLHLPEQQPETLAMLEYFMQQVVQSLQAGQTADALRYSGTLCHIIEDYGSPSHTVPGDNMFTLLKQFLPPTDKLQHQLLHGPIESGSWALPASDYQPQLLGLTVQEAAWRLLYRIHDGIKNARSTTVPIMQALYAEDAAAVEQHQLRAAKLNSQILADTLHTLFSLHRAQPTAAERQQLTTAALAHHAPLEAVHLYYPQSQFFSSPHWGFPQVGHCLAEGKRAVPIQLLHEGKVQTYPAAISAGMGKALTFLLPSGVYQKFSVIVGLHTTLGEKGRVEFSISGDGKPLQTLTLKGTDPAQAMTCDITGVRELRLSLTSKGLDPKANYAVWADPQVIKSE